MANSVCRHGQVLRRKDGHVLRMTGQNEGQRMERNLKRPLKRQVEEKSINAHFFRKMGYADQNGLLMLNWIANG